MPDPTIRSDRCTRTDDLTFGLTLYLTYTLQRDVYEMQE